MADWETVTKAWKLCGQRGYKIPCLECPYKNSYGDTIQCISELTKDSLDLVEKQRMEIKNLRMMLGEWEDCE